MAGSKDLEKSLWTKCGDASLSQFKGLVHEEGKIGKEKCSSFQSEESAITVSSPAEIGTTLTLSYINFSWQLLQEPVGYNLIRKDGSYMDRAVTSISRLDSWVATVRLCLVERGKCRGQRQSEYCNTYLSMVESTRR